MSNPSFESSASSGIQGRSVGYDARSLLINGERNLMLSGAIHYPRSFPEAWPDLMRRSREAGLNCVETYAFWNLHERTKGVYDFSGRLDLRRYCEAAQREGLNVILRIGPYICAETNFGGLPPWLIREPGIKIRTFNKPFMNEMERWVRALAGHMRPFFASQGGPIILAQIENEYANVAKSYGEDGARYCKWAVDLGLSLNLGVPLIMCSGSAPGAIETINAFLAQYKMERHFKEHPGKPALWTENWTGWYDTWGYSHHERSAEHVAYGVARFFAGGGSGVNYYMWHGGTNFGREAMYLQTTSYGFDAPLDEYGRPTAKARHLAKLHALLAGSAEILFSQPAPEIVELCQNASAYIYGSSANSIAFLCNDSQDGSAAFSFQGRNYTLPPSSAAILRNGLEAFNSSKIDGKASQAPSLRSTKARLSNFSAWTEPLPDKWPQEALRSSISASSPVEQLSITHDSTDYCWYSSSLTVRGRKAQKGVLTLKGAGDFVYVYVDGRLAASTPMPLKENRILEGDKDFTQSFELALKPGKRCLQILCCSIGLVKGDWMLGFQNMSADRKGIWGRVLWNSSELKGRWEMTPGLLGERLHLFASDCPHSWKKAAATERRSRCWWRAEFAAPAGSDPMALDLSSMGKGLLWVNGVCLGRYWLAPAAGRNPITTSESFIKTPESGRPVQRFYHVPRALLKERNELVIFEEQSGDPSSIKLLLAKSS